MFATPQQDLTQLQSPPRYQAIAPIGRGGMAEVFLAVMTGAGGITKLAVLKRIWPDLAGDPQFLAMFLDEARLSVRMTHPNLVQTYEVLEEDDRLAIAMEYLDGQPLSRVLNRLRGPQALRLPLKLRIVAKVLAGLDYAHELADYDGTPLSVVHRDVSPHNVFITYDGGVKLVDFGVAKNLASAHQTRPGVLKGKFSYMAPEQLLGRPTDRRADIFSVGVMMWELLVGQRFWNGISDGEIAAYLLSDRNLPCPPAGLGLPPGVEEICMRALQRERNQRYGTAAEMEADIERALSGAREAYDRPLGKAVSGGFAAERAQRQLLIDHHLRKVRSGSYSIPSLRFTAPPAALRTRKLRLVAISAAALLPVVALIALLSGRGQVAHVTAPVAAGERPGESDPTQRQSPPARSEPSEVPPAPKSLPVISIEADPVAEPSARRPSVDEPPRSQGAAARRSRRGSPVRPLRDAPPASPSIAAPSAPPSPATAFDQAGQRRPRPIDTDNPFLPPPPPSPPALDVPPGRPTAR